MLSGDITTTGKPEAATRPRDSGARQSASGRADRGMDCAVLFLDVARAPASLRNDVSDAYRSLVRIERDQVLRIHHELKGPRPPD
jgi:hypothetical protein